MSRKSICIIQKSGIVISFLVVLLISTMFCSSLITASKVNASTQHMNYTYYKSIQIESGDSLWSIAKRYQTQESKDISTYINEIKEINNLDSSKIHEGQYLTIPYNSYSKL